MEIKNNKDEFDPLMWANADNKKEEEYNTISSMESHLASHPTASQGKDVMTEVHDLAKIIIERNIDITQGYQNWLNLGFALSDALGEAGREVYHNLSRMNAGYNPSECDKQYTACMRGKKQGITIKTFFKMGKDAGIDLSQLGKEQQEAGHSPSSSATNANMPSAKNIEKDGKMTILPTLGGYMTDGIMADVAFDDVYSSNGYTFSDKPAMAEIPSYLYPVRDSQEDAEGRDKMMLTTLNLISGAIGGASMEGESFSGVYGIYDGKRVFAPLYNIVFGPAGVKKGDLPLSRQLIRPIKAEMRRDYEEELKKYEIAKAEYETSSKGKSKAERTSAPKEPAYQDPFVPANSSSTAVYRAMDANGGWGLMFETEADTVSAMLESDYGNYSDGLRKIFHNEPVSLNRITDKVHIDMEYPRLSVMLTCTGGQLPALFPSFENGLGSRFLFYELNRGKVEFRNVFARNERPLEEVYKQLGEDFLPLYHALKQRVDHPLQFVLSAEQQKKFVDTYSEMLREQFSMLGPGIEAFIYRIALSCFRYAMVLTVLRRLSDWNKSTEHGIFDDKENALVCDNRDFDIAMTIIGCLINHTSRVYAVLAKEERNPFAEQGAKLSADELAAYNALPDGDFSTNCFERTFAEIAHLSARTAARRLSDYSSIYRILVPIRRGVYRKAAIKTEED